jgi:hypothetical protein
MTSQFPVVHSNRTDARKALAGFAVFCVLSFFACMRPTDAPQDSSTPESVLTDTTAQDSIATPSDTTPPAPPVNLDSIPPRISYASPLVDTLGRAFSHWPVSTGGTVTSYSIEPFLPFGISLNATTGQISGTSSVLQAAKSYQVLATGPGGADTVTLTWAVVEPGIRITLGRSLTLEGAAANLPLSRASEFSPSRLILRIYNDNDPGTYIRDTLVAGTAGFSATPYGQVVLLPEHSFMAVKAFQASWRAEVQVFDAKNGLLYSGTAAASSSSAYLSFGTLMFHTGLFTAAFQLPELIQIEDGGPKQTIRFDRLVVRVDDVVRADVAPGAPFTPNAIAYVNYPMSWTSYLLTKYLIGYHDATVTLSVYGRVGSGTSRLLFESSYTIPYYGGGSGPPILGSLSWVGNLPYSGRLSVGLGRFGQL